MHPEYDTKLHALVSLYFWSPGDYEITQMLSLLPGPLSPKMSVLVMVLSLDQVDLF